MKAKADYYNIEVISVSRNKPKVKYENSYDPYRRNQYPYIKGNSNGSFVKIFS